MPYVESKTTIKGDGAKIYDIIKDICYAETTAMYEID